MCTLVRYGVGAVSPEGVLRYWRGWTVDKPHSEITVPVGGDCVHSMTNLEVRLYALNALVASVSICRVVMGLY